MQTRPIIAITMGDPVGIGPEIVMKTLNNPEFYKSARPIVIGDMNQLQKYIFWAPNVHHINSINEVSKGTYEHGTIDVIHCDTPGVSDLPFGEVNALAGQAGISYILKGIELANNRMVDAIVTGPINKEAFHLAGFTQYAGHTEILAEKTGTKDYAMMLAVNNLFVIHNSTHCSLREACNKVTKEKVLKTIHLANELVNTYQLENSTIAIAGLNPHSGEAGAFGTEEIHEIIPAIEEAKTRGIKAVGPIPPDSLFVRALRGEYAVMVVMYHDQGHMPIKVIDFDKGVNITLGLPIIRTSVDHGTAFGIAGKGIASSASMDAALSIAIELATRKYYTQ